MDELKSGLYKVIMKVIIIIIVVIVIIIIIIIIILMNFECIGILRQASWLRLRAMYVLFLYGIQTFYTAIIIIIIIIIVNLIII